MAARGFRRAPHNSMDRKVGVQSHYFCSTSRSIIGPFAAHPVLHGQTRRAFERRLITRR